MTFNIQQLKTLIIPQIPWEVDFRDKTVVVHAENRFLKLYSTIGLGVVAALLGLWTCINFFGAQTNKHRLEEMENFIKQSAVKRKGLMDTNAKFIAKKDLLFNIIGAYESSLDVALFFQDLMNLKTNNIKYATILIKDTKNSTQANSKKAFSIELFGSLNDDVDYLEKYKSDLLSVSALVPMQGKFKNFYKIDRSQTSNNEIKFQLTIQTNE